MTSKPPPQIIHVSRREPTYKLKGDRRAEAHPAANAFLLPDRDGIQRLAENIQRVGQLVAVVLQRFEGLDLVIDGRCRLLACEHAGITPQVRYVGPNEDPLELIVSGNLVRRHQSASLRALAAARLLTIHGPGRPAVIASLDAITAGKAGRWLGISRASVQRAKVLLDHPILVAAVESEAVSIGDAYAIRGKDENAQHRAVEAVNAGAATTLQAALAQDAPKGPDGVASDPAQASQAGRSETGAPGAEPNGRVKTSEDKSVPSDPPSAASGQSAPAGASAAARHPDAGNQRAASDSLTPRAESGDTPGGTTPNVEGPDTDVAEAARTALDAATELRRSLDDVRHAITDFLADGDRIPQRLRGACGLLQELAADIGKSLGAMDDDPDRVVLDVRERQVRTPRPDGSAPNSDADADSETASN